FVLGRWYSCRLGDLRWSQSGRDCLGPARSTVQGSALSSFEGLVAALSEEALLGSFRPPQVEIRSPVGVDAASPYEHPRQASEQDGNDRGCAASSRREPTA